MEDLNINSIGIELVNKGHRFGYEKFNDLQINKLIVLQLLTGHYLFANVITSRQQNKEDKNVDRNT